MNVEYSVLWLNGRLEVVREGTHPDAAGYFSLAEAKAVVRRFNRFWQRKRLALYHVTYAADVARILRDGLLPLWKSVGGEPEMVYLFGNRSDADKYLLWRQGWPGRKRKQEILTVTMPSRSLAQITPDVEDYMIENYRLPLKHLGAIPPHGVSRLTKFTAGGAKATPSAAGRGSDPATGIKLRS
jgi:hypothetical protein